MSVQGVNTSEVSRRAAEIFERHRVELFRKTDRLLSWLMIAQWVAGIVIALVLSPYAWVGKAYSVHTHVYTAIFLGGALSSLPVFLAWKEPGAPITRYTIAIAQMLWSALLIHLTGGRIETHFHVFGSLAIVAFYREWKVLLPATVVVATDHFLRGLLWPESVYGLQNPEWWRFLEHAFWVVFEDIFLILYCVRGMQELRAISERQAEVESLSESERTKSVELNKALTLLQESQEALVRNEKLAAVGQLAASVGHELRNPLAAIRNAHTYIGKRLSDPKADGLGSDARIQQFLGIMERELDASAKIISNLLDFARTRPPTRSPCPLRPLVDEAISLVPPKAKVTVYNDVSETLPVPSLDKDQFRQVLVNLIQNATEAMPNDREGEVRVKAAGGGNKPWSIVVSDNGLGMPADVIGKIFQPLFSTKTKGTGLGLAIVASMIEKHKGTMKVQSELGKGSEFVIELPPEVASTKAA